MTAPPAARRAPSPAAASPPQSSRSPVAAHARLRARPIVLVGLMGVGKTTLGRSLAHTLAMPFRDADREIERAADRTIAEIFAEHGEAAFRDGERRVIARLLREEGAHVLAAGGGAFVNAQTRDHLLAEARVVWLRADLDILARRVARRNTRPLLAGRDPREVMEEMAAARHPIYAQAHVHVDLDESGPSVGVSRVIEALNAHLDGVASG